VEIVGFAWLLLMILGNAYLVLHLVAAALTVGGGRARRLPRGDRR
jgi:hypothetical protein